MRRAILVTGLAVLVAGGARAKDPAAKATPAELVEAFLTNEAYADETYVDKEVELTGKVVRVSRSKGTGRDGGRMYVLELDAGKAGRTEREDLDLLFYFDESDRAQLARLKAGQTVVVRGTCGRRLTWPAEARNKDKDYSQVRVLDCRLVEVK
jgi:tRNA_anti-like